MPSSLIPFCNHSKDAVSCDKTTRSRASRIRRADYLPRMPERYQRRRMVRIQGNRHADQPTRAKDIGNPKNMYICVQDNIVGGNEYIAGAI